MRQAGVIAAPAIISLEKMSKRLQVDHDNARKLAEGLAAMEGLGVCVDVTAVQTNIVTFSFKRDDMTTEEFIQRLDSCDEGEEREHARVRITTYPSDPSLVRAVTHHHVTEADIELTLRKMARVLKS